MSNKTTAVQDNFIMRPTVDVCFAGRRGEKRGIEMTRKVFKMKMQGKTDEKIAAECKMSVRKVREILK